ncbi:MAG: NAD(P)/FAD-dependent oxidoreductase [Burkholderiaceae bacterium]
MTNGSPKIVIVGAGIAGVAAAYFLSVEHGCRDVVLLEADNPLSLTSDKSTEAYRNWWPGPDSAMTAYMNRSIDLMEGLAQATGNRINLSRNGYLFASADAGKTDWLVEMSRLAEQHGAGPVRVHDSDDSEYVPKSSIDSLLTGADIITDPGLIARHFPYLNPETKVLAHARRAGWVDAQQLGMIMLELARERGATFMRARVVDIHTTNNQVSGVIVEQEGQRQLLPADQLVIAAGPMLKEVVALLGIEMPVVAERHLKISLPDGRGVIPSDAPMLIWLDDQHLPWTDDERAALTADGTANWLLDKFPGGVHCRPIGGGSSKTILGLYTYDGKPEPVVFPLREEPHYAEIVLRGLSTMVPALREYVEKGARPYLDGGYYVRTRENRPLIGPLPVQGAFVSGAYSGFGIMASCAGGDLIAKHLTGSTLPDYAPAFMLSRYTDPDYLAMLDNSSEDGQL